LLLRGVWRMTYENLLLEVETEGIQLKEKKLKHEFSGLYCDGRIIIDTALVRDCEKRCVLSEELGHHYKTVGDITDQTKIENRKQELLARRWGYEKLIGIVDLINAYRNGIRNRYELSEYLHVTEEFLEETINYYRCKYENGCEIDNYWITFDNGLNIVERFY
jgi:hypothetical protein